jgi:AbrB family looped-hinge helix DNA binding protein
MAELATTKMSSKGQVVIPEDIRKRLGLEAGSQFIVIAGKDAVILKTISPPSMDEFDTLIRKARLQARGYQEGRCRGTRPPMTIVLDTNVLISGIYFSGPPSTILQAWRTGKFQLAVSIEILEEYISMSLNGSQTATPALNTKEFSV